VSQETKVNLEPGRLGRGRFPAQGLPWNSADTILLVVLFALSFLLYWSVLTFGFVYDDEIFIVHNPLILSWKSVPVYFTQSLTSYVPLSAPNYYRPLMLVWLLINRKFWGLSTLGWHFSTLTLHVLVTLSVYLLARRLLDDRLSAGLAGALFAAHPIHVEVVAWAAAFPDSLAALPVITGFLCYLRGRSSSRHRAAWLTVSAFLYALAILAKEIALALPAIIVAYEWLHFPRAEDSSRRAGRLARIGACLRAVAPYLALTGIYFVARFLALKGFGHVVAPISPGTLVGTLPLVTWTYLRHLCWPVGLSAFYDVRYVVHPGLGNFLLPAAAIVAVAAGLWWWSRKSRQAAMATLWLVVPLLPVLDLALLPYGETVHDRYLYLPSVGFVLLVAMGLRRIASGGLRLLGQPALPVVSGVILVGLLSFGTISYSRFWSDNLTLYRRGVAIAPGNNIVTNNLANELVARGQYPEAVRLYQQIVERSPDFWLANYNLGYCFYKLNKLPEAEQYLSRAIRLNPSDPDQFVYVGLTRFKMGRLPEAELALRHAIALRPDGVGYHFALGLLLKTRGESAAALEQFRTELRYHPGQTAARRQIDEIEARHPNDSPPSAPNRSAGKRD
jgi:tetratricopeptide (TPR) repeat protein